MATTFCKENATVAQQDQGSQNITNKKGTSNNTPSSTGSRIIPLNAYKFVLGERAEMQASFSNNDKPIQVDAGSKPKATIYQDNVPIETIEGELTSGQTYEYSFFWDIPSDYNPRRLYQVKYSGFLGGVEYVWGDEYFDISASPSNIKMKRPAYATVDQLRSAKPNIDSYLPSVYKSDKTKRDNLLQEYLADSSLELNGQLNLRDFHSVYNDNFNLYVKYHAIWAILGSQLGEDGSSVSDRTLGFWEKRWKHTLKQIKMHSQLSHIPTGRA